MANNLSDVGAALARRWMFSTSSMSGANVRPIQWFLALYTSTPSDAGGGTEVGTGRGYSRQEITFDATGSTNSNIITFGPATLDWGTITAGAIFDDQGRFLMWVAVTSIVISAGAQLQYLAGELDVTR